MWWSPNHHLMTMNCMFHLRIKGNHTAEMESNERRHSTQHTAHNTAYTREKYIYRNWFLSWLPRTNHQPVPLIIIKPYQYLHCMKMTYLDLVGLMTDNRLYTLCSDRKLFASSFPAFKVMETEKKNTQMIATKKLWFLFNVIIQFRRNIFIRLAAECWEWPFRHWEM